MDSYSRRTQLCQAIAPGVLTNEHKAHGWVCDQALEDLVAADLLPSEQPAYLERAAAARREPRDVEAHARMMAAAAPRAAVAAPRAAAPAPRGTRAPVAVSRAVAHAARPVEVRRPPAAFRSTSTDPAVRELEGIHGRRLNATEHGQIATARAAGVARAARRGAMDLAMGIVERPQPLGNIDGTVRAPSPVERIAESVRRAAPALTPAPRTGSGLSPAQRRAMGLDEPGDASMRAPSMKSAQAPAAASAMRDHMLRAAGQDVTAHEAFGARVEHGKPAPLSPAQRRAFGGA